MDSDVLVADDSAAIRKILQRVLRQTGMAISEIHEAGDGQQALDFLRSRRVALILTGINMPRMDGLELLAAIKASWAAVPVVMITTEGRESEVAEAVRLGAAGYVRKPFTADQIKEKLAGLPEPADAMNVHNLIVSSLQHAVMELFSTMINGEIQFEGVSEERETPESCDRVVSFIGVAGTWSGSGTLTCSPRDGVPSLLTDADGRVLDGIGGRAGRRCRTDEHDHRQRQKQSGTPLGTFRPKHTDGGFWT